MPRWTEEDTAACFAEGFPDTIPMHRRVPFKVITAEEYGPVTAKAMRLAARAGVVQAKPRRRPGNGWTVRVS